MIGFHQQGGCRALLCLRKGDRRPRPVLQVLRNPAAPAGPAVVPSSFRMIGSCSASAGSSDSSAWAWGEVVAVIGLVIYLRGRFQHWYHSGCPSGLAEKSPFAGSRPLAENIGRFQMSDQGWAERVASEFRKQRQEEETVTKAKSLQEQQASAQARQLWDEIKKAIDKKMREFNKAMDGDRDVLEWEKCGVSQFRVARTDDRTLMSSGDTTSTKCS